MMLNYGWLIFENNHCHHDCIFYDILQNVYTEGCKGSWFAVLQVCSVKWFVLILSKYTRFKHYNQCLSDVICTLLNLYGVLPHAPAVYDYSWLWPKWDTVYSEIGCTEASGK